ncbi:MAG: hypothetical protein U0167_14020 [bacterium]
MSGRRLIPAPSVLVAAIASSLILLAAPCRADIAPESGLFPHVQSVSGSCETPITTCTQITRSTSQEGPVEFLIFFMRGNISVNEPVCLISVSDWLTWPDAWQLLEFEACGPAYGYGYLDPRGARHLLSVSYWGGQYAIGGARDVVVPVARLVMNVVGPGRLDIVGSSAESGATLQHQCTGSTFVTHPVKVYAEAGIPCGHISAHCGYHDNLCEPTFRVPELRLSAPSGGAADSTVGFSTPSTAWWHPCSVTVDTHAPWCTAWVEGDYGTRLLHVAGEASGLVPGQYETAIELSIGVPNGGVSRCLPVVFTVEQPMATSTVSWGRVKALYR